MANTSTLPPQVEPPAFALSAADLPQIADVEIWAVPVLASEELLGDPAHQEDPSCLLGPGSDRVAAALDLDLFALAEALGVTGAVGEVTALPVVSTTARQLRQLLLVGVGQANDAELRRAGAALGRAVKDCGTLATTVPSLSPGPGLEEFIIGLMLGSFEFHWRSAGAQHQPVERVVLAGLPNPEEYADALARALAVGGAAWQSRVLATVPANLKNPPWLAELAEQVAQDSGLKVTVWDEEQLAKDGFGGILAVGAGSSTPPRLVELAYVPSKRARSTPHVVLVGKGITFDTGGLNLKPAEGMTTMKRDMTGAAAVLATMAALRDLGCPARVTALLPLAENAVSGSAMRPGDVIEHYGGRTSEVNNTDAEGRLVMADALAYAVDKLKPDVLVDVATLTGAMKVALGLQLGGFFANDDALAAALSAAGETAGEQIWRMPLVRDYAGKISSRVADLDNAAGGAGAITAALYLEQFTGDVPWAHLDLAPVGDVLADRDEWTAGPSGFGARLLLRWLLSDSITKR